MDYVRVESRGKLSRAGFLILLCRWPVLEPSSSVLASDYLLSHAMKLMPDSCKDMHIAVGRVEVIMTYLTVDNSESEILFPILSILLIFEVQYLVIIRGDTLELC